MIDPIVRPATDGDRDAIAWLESLSRASLRGQRGGDRWLETNRSHGGAVDAAATAWVATIDGVVIGYLVSVLDADIARIADVFVHPEARELGFGDALLRAALDDARAAGARLFEGEALPGDRNTKNLYERAGITARLITVSTLL